VACRIVVIEPFRILLSVSTRAVVPFRKHAKEWRTLALWLVLAALQFAARFCHLQILWAEEGYGSAAAVQILHGKMLYRDFWFDKPPLAALLYVLWRGEPGAGLRIAGAVYALGCAVAAYRLASHLWGRREAIWAACLMTFFLIFDIPASVMTLAPDLLLILPAIAAVDCAARRQPLQAGLWCSVGLAVNAKAVLIFAVCLAWCWPAFPSLCIGAIAGTIPWILWLALSGALPAYWQQVWWFGAEYSRDTFVMHPLREALLRTLNWAGFHAAIVIAAGLALWKQKFWNARWLMWLASGLLAVAAGDRFFPRYYFLLLPPVLLLAARGCATMRRRWQLAVLFLLAVPLVRFGPRYVLLASDALSRRQTNWADVVLNEDSRNAAKIVNAGRRPSDTLLVWGYRPDLFAYTQLPAGTPFLDSQMLTGTLADRHLTSSHITFPALAAANRERLLHEQPTWIVDGLGPLNPALAIERYPDLLPWMQAHYRPWARTRDCIIYRSNAQ
jgi:4-amino-4-deoxy-L-arabinose transferase-like glycosyltransferase